MRHADKPQKIEASIALGRQCKSLIAQEIVDDGRKTVSAALAPLDASSREDGPRPSVAIKSGCGTAQHQG